MITQDWDWITEEEFQEAINKQAIDAGWEYILGLTGIYEIIAEELNNVALTTLAESDDRCTHCGNKLSDEGKCECEL